MRSRLLTHALLTSCSGASLLLASAFHAQALPTGGQVESGSATITQPDANNLVIDQHTDRAIINWQNFNIGSGQSTRFNQLSASSVALNRVLDGNPTQILGNLSANGRVFIVNPNGVIFGAGSRVDVAGLVATTANIRSADFMAGRMHFNQAGNRDARIVNEGNITAKDGGLVALVAPSVHNSGVITARMGTVAIGAAQTVALDFYGDNLYGFKLGEQAQGAGAGVNNTGTIAAQGGRVLLSAKTAQDVVNQAINLEGVVDATSMREVGGEIVIDGGEGSVRVAGTLNASGKNAGEKGGRIQVTGKKITLAGATVDATGSAGGGSVRIGGDKKGGGTIARADYVDVDSASIIDVSATNNGNGGSSVVWSDIATNFYGRLRGRGGENGGDGGFAEVSSKNTLSYNSAADLGAAKGKGGHLLLDPVNFVIDALNVAGFIATLNGGTDVTIETFDPSGLDAGDITIDAAMNWSGLGSLILNAMNDIIVNQSITSTTVAAGGNVIMNSANNNTINAAITTSGGTIDINNSGAGVVAVNAALTSATGGIDIDSAGTIDVNNGANIDAGTGALVLTATGGTTIADADLSGTGVTLNTSVVYDGAPIMRGIYARNGVLTINGPVNASGISRLNLVADDFAINNTVTATGFGSVYVSTHTSGATLGLAGAAGGGQLSSAELNRFTTALLSIGGETTNVGAHTWSSNIARLVLGANDVNLNIVGDQNFNQEVMIRADGSLNIGAQLINVGAANNQIVFDFIESLGVGGGAGTVQLDDAELDRIADGWGRIVFRNVDFLNMGAYNNWRDTVSIAAFNSQDVTISGDQVAVGGAGDVDFLFYTLSDQAIDISGNIDVTAGGSGNIVLGGAGGSNAYELGANLIGNNITVAQPVTVTGAPGVTRLLHANTGTFTISDDGFLTNGSIDTGTANVALVADNMTIGGAITGAGTAYFRAATLGRSMGLAGGVGDLQIDSNELDLISAANQVYGDAAGIGFTAGAIDVAARSWAGHGLTIVTTGELTVSGNQNYSNMSYLSLGASDYDIAANLNDVTNNNALLFYFTGTPMSIGGAVGTTNIDSAELDRIQDGFASIQFGAGAASDVTVNAYNNWRDPIQFTNAGTLLISGAQSAASGSNAGVQFASGGLTTINSNVDFSDSTTGGIHFTGSNAHSVNLRANLFSGADGITIDRVLNLVGAAGATRRIDAGLGAVTVNNDGVSTFGAINGTNKNLRLFGNALNLNGATISSTSGNIRFDGGSVTLTNGQINSTSGNITLNNTGVFFSSLPNSLNTGGTGTIDVNQWFGGSINNAIAAISNTGTGWNTVDVGDGIFVENIQIDQNNLRLRSMNGRDATTITGISGVGALGTIVVLNNVNNSQIGGTNRGFTVNGIDNGNPAIENAAIYYQGNHDTTLVRGNRIVAMGDSALVTEYGLNNANFTIDGNIITGNTFTGADGDWGVGNQFVVPNVPRQLVAFNQGLSNVVFTNNQITGNSGTAHLVAIESAGINVADNTFNGLTHGAALRLRGSGVVTVTDNSVDGSNRGRGMHISGVADSVFTNNDVANTAIGIWIDGSDNATITGGTLTNNTTGIRINPSVSGLVDGVTIIGGTTGLEVISSDDTTIQNSSITDALTGVSVTDSAGFIATNNVLNSNAITPTTNAGFDLVNTTGAQLTDNTIRGFRTGINLSGGSDATITGGIIRGADVAGINSETHSNLNVNAVNIRTVGTAANGIRLVLGGSATVRGSQITTRGNGIYADTLEALGLYGNTIDAPGSASGIYGISVNNVTNAQIGSLTLGEGNTISNMEYGISVSNSLGADILGNTINGDNNHTGIQVTDSDNIAVRGNILQVLSDLGNVAFEFDAIRVLGSTYADIRQNILTAANDGQLAGRYGIYVDGSHGVRIRGNDLTANSGGTLARNDAIRATGSNYADIRNNDLIANGGTISRNGSAIHVMGTPYATIFRNDLTASNGGILAGQDGIWAEYASGATINNNRITVTGESGITPIGRDGIHVSFGGKGGDSVAEINDNTITAETGNVVDRHGIHVEHYGNAYFVSEMEPMMIGWPYYAPQYTGGLVIDDNIITGTGVDGIRVRGDYARVMDDSVGGGDEEGEPFVVFGDLPPEGFLAQRAPLQITNNRITNTGDDGIDSEGAVGVIINDNRIRFAGGHGITADVVGEARRNNVRYTDGHGIFLRDSDNVQVTDNLVRDAEYDGIRIQNSSFAYLENNTVRDSNRGIHVLSVGDGVSDNATLTGNTTYDNSQEGVRVRGGNNHTITNNVSYDNGAQGFRLIGIGNTLIDGNTAEDNGAAGIRVEDSETITITNNTSNGNLRGIRVLNGSNITVTDNITNDNRREGIRFDTVVNSPVVTGNTMVNNLVGFAAYNRTDNLTLNGNIFTNNATGVLFNNSDNGRLEDTIIDIAAGGTGLLLENGAGNFIVRDVTFNGGEVAVLIDGGIFEDSIGGGEEEFSPSISLVDNGPTGMQFESNGSFFNGNNFYFVLRNGAMLGETLIATQQTFDGVRAANFSVAQRDAAEAKTIDVQDGFSVGDVFYRSFIFNFSALDQLAQMKGNPFSGDVFSYDGLTLSNNILLNNFQFDLTGLNLSLLNPAAGGGNGGSAGDLNDLSTAGGGKKGDKNAGADQLNDLETAAGGNQDTCGNSYLGSGAEFGYNGGSCSGNGGSI